MADPPSGDRSQGRTTRPATTRTSSRGKNVDALIANAKTAIKFAKPLASNFPVPGLGLALDLADQCLDKLDEVRVNGRKKKDVISKIQALVDMLKSTTQETTEQIEQIDHNWRGELRGRIQGSDLVKRRVDRLVSKLEDVLASVDPIIRKHCLARVWYSKQDAQALDDVSQDIKEAMNNFHTQGEITMQQLMLELVTQVKVEALDKANREALDGLKRSESASHKSPYVDAKATLQPGTRERILNQVLDWARSSDPDRRVQVIYGPAGVGKSAIARAVSEALDTDDARYLGASFFFQRGVPECNDPYLVFPTIAHQIAHSRPELLNRIAESVRKYMHHGSSQAINHQGFGLLVDPLTNEGLELPLVLVVDGIDECLNSEEDPVPKMLKALIHAASIIPSLRILIATRPESYIMRAIAPDNDSIVMRNLWEDAFGEVEDDIRLYIRTKFIEAEGGGSFTLLKDRPDCVGQLTTLAGKLFIYANTVVRFLTGRDERLAVRIYDQLLESQGLQSPTGIHGKLDKLYITILANAFDDELREDRNRVSNIRLILAWFSLNTERKCSPRLLKLLVPEEITMDVIGRLTSVLVVDGSITSETVMQACHASFPQFLIDRNRCRDSDFCVDSETGHGIIASSLLDFLCHRDVMVVTAGDGDTEMVQYATERWIEHLVLACRTDDLTRSLHTFVDTHLEKWLVDVGQQHDNISQVGLVDRISRVQNWYKAQYNVTNDTLLKQLEAIADRRYKDLGNSIKVSPSL